MNPDDPNPLLDSRGNPIRKPQSDREALEALIRSELTEAKEKLRDSNKEGLEEIADKYYKPKISFWHKSNGYTLVALVAVLLFGLLAVPEIIKTKTTNYIRENLVGAALTNTVDDVIKEKADALIDARLKPLNTDVELLGTKINDLNLDNSNKQAQLVSDQKNIREQIHPLSGQIISLQASVNTAQEQAKQLQEEQKLTTLLNRGEVFDKDAIQELQAIAQSTNETAPLAQAMFNKIQRNLLIDRGASSWVSFSQMAGGKRYDGPFTSDELALSLSSSSGSTVDGVVNVLNNNKLFVPKLVELAHQSKDVWTISRIGKKLKEIADVDFFPWDLQPLDQWWKISSSSYTNWPLDKFQAGFTALGINEFNTALTDFEFVVKIDPTADQSRALAIASAIEIGDVPRAQLLNTNYALPGERWQRWANAKIMLATNGIQPATEEFVSLAKKYPTFSIWTTKDGAANYFIRHIDWALYSKLMQATNDTVSGK